LQLEFICSVTRMNESGGGTLSLPRELRRRDSMRVMGNGKNKHPRGLVFYCHRSPQHRRMRRNSRHHSEVRPGKCGSLLRSPFGSPLTRLRLSRRTTLRTRTGERAGVLRGHAWPSVELHQHQHIDWLCLADGDELNCQAANFAALSRRTDSKSKLR
jgi:hypothetical protein